MQFDPEKLDFDRCEDEPIHQPEAVQRFGYLLAIEPRNREIAIHSDNLQSLFASARCDGMIGQDFREILDEKVVSWAFILKTYQRALSENVRLPIEIRIREAYAADPERRDFHAVVFGSGELMVVEIEPASLYSTFAEAKQYGKIYSTNVAPNFAKLGSVQELVQSIADSIRALTGYERVVVYRFNEDDTGTVISESKVDDIESYLSLHYPATDIPRQARALYLKNWIRLNPDVDVPPVRLIPTPQESGRPPLDLTQSVIRAMSPIHLQYVRNQGVRSVMSISLINRDRLWGIISCHHRNSHYIPQDVRLECESLGHLFGWQIYAKEEEVQAKAKAETERTIDLLVEGLGAGKSIVEIFSSKEKEVLDLMDASGFVFCSGDDMVRLGETPLPSDIRALSDRTRHAGGDEPFFTTKLSETLTDYTGADVACGALVIPIVATQGYFTIWFRKEIPRMIKWAGRPEEKSYTAPKKDRLTPRGSFKVHEEIVEGESRPWLKSDIEIALRFNRIFLRHALQRKIEMQQSINRLEVRDQVKDEFLATLAHELRNPLSPISNSISVLKASKDEQHQQEAIAIAERQLKNLVTLVDDLLDVSRITRGKIRLAKKKLDLRQVLKSALETNDTLLKEERHQVDCDLPDEPLWVHGDFTRLTQCFGNILNNAAKYTPRGGRIRISARADRGDALVDIEDNGVGIPKSHLQKIFDIFAQVDAGSTQTRGGLGIGLTLTRKLVQRHDGSISVASRGKGQGSCFTIVLPLLTKREEQEPATSAEEETPSSGTSFQILLVEDNQDVAKMLALLLRLKGHTVSVCHTPDEAIELYPELKPDLALLDIGLPQMDGYELCRRLKAKNIGKDVTFVAQTGWGQKERQEASTEAGFHYHLVKPVDEAMLDRVLTKMSKTS